ncbi:unnamed protein product [Aphanomyces euteiches]
MKVAVALVLAVASVLQCQAEPVDVKPAPVDDAGNKIISAKALRGSQLSSIFLNSDTTYRKNDECVQYGKRTNSLQIT